MRQLAVQREFLEPPREFALNADSGAVDFNHLVMLAIERALAPPIVHRRSTFQPMRVVVVDREMFSRADAREEIGREMPRLLPPAVQRSAHPAWQIQQRPVRGEILSDECGRLFEKLGRQIRPLHHLASGPFGEVIDLVPAKQSSLPATAPTSQPQLVDSPETTKASPGQKETEGADDDTATSKFVPLQEPTKQTNTISHRKLFADPGQWRVLSWGEFKEILSPQLAHPERLRDTYRLPCYVQVLETERTVSIAELAGIYKSENQHHARLYFLTDDIAAKLDLVLPLRPVPPPNARRQPNTLSPYDRVFRLVVANDPTIDVANSRSKLQPSTSQQEGFGSEVKGSEPRSASTSLKEAIPSRFVKEWEFKISREEASYDMNARLSLGNWIRRIWRRFRAAGELRKWQTLLTGKDADEQLWAVRPPKGMLADSLLRDWATKTLEFGGYNSRKMITEWEIYWRRKGF